MSNISKRILSIILAKDISYGELSERTGIPKSALQRYATGQTEKIPIDRLELIASAIGTSAAYLMGWETEAKESTPTVSGEQFIDMSDVDVAFYGGYKELSEDDQKTIRDMVQLMRERRTRKDTE